MTTHLVRPDLLEEHRFFWVRNQDLICFLCSTAVFRRAVNYNFSSTFPTWLEWLREEIHSINAGCETDTTEDVHWRWGTTTNVLKKVAEISLDRKPYLIWHQYRLLDYLLVTKRAIGLYHVELMEGGEQPPA